MASKEYLEATKDMQPSPSLIEALTHCTDSTKALDVGCGAFVDSNFLVSKGFYVDAVDKSNNVLTYYKNSEYLNFHNIPIENFDLQKNAYNLVNAQYSLPFINPLFFTPTLEKILSSLKVSGVFVGQFFGPEDEWAKNNNMTFLNSEQVKELFKHFELIKIDEHKENGVTAIGNTKYWHIFHIIAVKN